MLPQNMLPKFIASDIFQKTFFQNKYCFKHCLKHACTTIIASNIAYKACFQKTFTYLAVFGLCGNSDKKKKTQDLHGALRIEIEISTESIKGDN